MQTIDVDFEVFKALTMHRKSEDVTYNDVIRDLLKLPPAFPTAVPAGPSADDWMAQGVRFPAGSEFQKTYKGKLYTAKVERGALYYNGKPYDSPSAAGAAVAGYFVNGWTFWEVRVPGSSRWRVMDSFR